jgi:AhpD family alkylhydroperoxidase
MEARIPNATQLLPDVVPAVQQLIKAVHTGDAPESILELVHLRSSQINGCSYCVDMGWRSARQKGVSDEKLFAVAAWRETPYFDDAERAALALAEYATRLADSSDAVPDHVWNAAAEHFTNEQLASIVLWIGITNFFNRVNVTLQTPAGQAA